MLPHEDSEPESSSEENSQPSSPEPEAFIGRSDRCSTVLKNPVIQSRHAVLNFDEGRFTIRGLGAGGGLFLNDAPVSEGVLEPGDRLRIGPFLFTFDGSEVVQRSDSDRFLVDAYSVTRKASGKEILSEVSLSFVPGQVVAVVGPSGAGKTTLLECLHGSIPPDSGRVNVNGEDLRKAFSSLKLHLGYVPQDDIIHRDLRVKDALLYTAKLRLAKDHSTPEIMELCDGVLRTIDLFHKRDDRIRTLSGGERKRVNLAVELLTEPSALFCDEPTSGLDPANERKLMRLFRSFADQGRTVVISTHVLESVDLVDLIAVLHQGRLVYFGPPEDALSWFGVDRLSKLYEVLEDGAVGHWARKYEESEAKKRWVDARRHPLAIPSRGSVSTKKFRRGPSWWNQFGVLSRRYASNLAGDALNLATLILPGPLIGLLATIPLNSRKIDDQFKLLFFLTIAAVFCGCFHSFREIVKERAIFRRERLVGQGMAPYLFSKVMVLSILLGLECTLLLGTVCLFEDVGGRLSSHFFLLWGTSITGAGLGLLVSSLVRKTENAIGLVILVLLPQIIFSGGLARLDGLADVIGQGMISYWCFQGVLEISRVLGDGVSELAALMVHLSVYLGLAASMLLWSQRRRKGQGMRGLL